MKRILYTGIVFFLLTSIGASGEVTKEQKPIVVKIATIAPEGSTWMDIIDEYESYVKERTGGKVKFIVYAGGVLGDEPEMVRKIKLGQIHGGGFSGMGLGKIVPEVRVLEVPMMFRNYEEVDYILHKLDGTLRKLFDDRGFVLLGWAEQGFLYLFTNKPVHKFEDLAGVKVWVWAGDNFARIIFDSIGYLTPIPIAVPEVLQSLQTGLINAFYNSPLGAVALQWYPHVKYMISIPITYATGAVVIEKKIFVTFPPDLKKALIDGGKIFFPKLISSVRKDNAQFLKSFPKQGIEFIDPDPGLEQELREKFEIAHQRLIGEFYPEWLLTGVKRSLYELREKK